jgi:two-component system sensor histidine kinase/response regulator
MISSHGKASQAQRDTAVNIKIQKKRQIRHRVHTLSMKIHKTASPLSANQDKPRLLVIDDDVMMREIMSNRLTRRGYHVTLAENGYQGLESITGQKFDLVLLDMMMPGMSGLEVLEEVRKSYSMLSLPVIMVTAVDQHETIITALESGANDYLVKPVNLEVALARINSQLTLNYLSKKKDEFVSFASHDLKKPLMLMLDIAYSLQQDHEAGQIASPKSYEDIELMIRTGENMKDVIEGFLNQETQKAGQIRLECDSVNLNNLIGKIVTNNSVYAQKKQIELLEDLDLTLPTVQVDELRIMEVLDNLVGNALKFSPKGTRTVLRTRHDDIFVYGEVSDSGPGIKSEDQDKLFVKRAKLSAKPTGGESSSGLGLAICRQLIDLHNGKIGARNNEEGGATFWFQIPIQTSSRKTS